MSDKKIDGISISLSVLFHAILIVIFMLLNLSFDYEPSEYVELSFGVSSEEGSSGSEGNQIDKIEEKPNPRAKTKRKIKTKR